MLSSAFKCRPRIPLTVPFLISSPRLPASALPFPFASAGAGANNNGSKRQAVFITLDFIGLFFRFAKEGKSLPLEKGG